MEDYEHVLRVNLLGLIQITKLFKEHIKLAKFVLSIFNGNSEKIKF